MKMKNQRLIIIFSLLLFLVVSCGGEDSKQTNPTVEDCEKEDKFLSENGKECVELEDKFKDLDPQSSHSILISEKI